MTDATIPYAQPADPPQTASVPVYGGPLAVLLTIWAVLIGAALIQNLLDLSSETRVWLLDVDMERSVYTWFSQLLLVAAAVLLANIGVAHRRWRRDLAIPFLILSALACALSIDEGLSLHELLSEKISAISHPTGWLTFVWVVPAAAMCLVTLVAFLPFLFRLDRSTRNRMLIAAAVFVTGAIGFEVLEARLFSVEGGGNSNYDFRLLTVAEEAMEGLGVILLIAALLDYRRRHRIVF